MTAKSTLDRVGVIGSGLMGAEIALVFALAGHDVRLMDVSEEKLAAAVQRLTTLLDKGVTRGFYTADRAGGAIERIATTTAIAEMADRSVVVEAVFEQEAAKAEIFRQLDTVCSSDCIIPTNTSTIPISVLASYVSEPRRPRFIGTHYFSPASRMQLVEVIPGSETSGQTTQGTLDLCRAIGKTPVTIKDVPGFAINRLLHVFMIEAVRLVEEGVATVGGHRCRLPSRARPSYGAVRVDGRDNVQPVPASPGNHARCLRRTLPSTATAQTTCAGRLCRGAQPPGVASVTCVSHMAGCASLPVCCKRHPPCEAKPSMRPPHPG